MAAIEGSVLEYLLGRLPVEGSDDPLRILDIGSGGVSSFKESAFDTDFELSRFGLDLDFSVVSAGRKDTSWLQGDGSRLPFPDSCVDVVLTRNLYSVPPGTAGTNVDVVWDYIRHEAMRVLRPSGSFIIADWLTPADPERLTRRLQLAGFVPTATFMEGSREYDSLMPQIVGIPRHGFGYRPGYVLEFKRPRNIQLVTWNSRRRSRNLQIPVDSALEAIVRKANFHRERNARSR